MNSWVSSAEMMINRGRMENLNRRLGGRGGGIGVGGGSAVEDCEAALRLEETVV